MRAYRFIEGNSGEFGLRRLLRRTGIFPNAYYNYLRQAKKGYSRHKAEILGKISEIYHETGGILGHRSMRIFLLRRGIRLSRAEGPYDNAPMERYYNSLKGSWSTDTISGQMMR